MRSYHAESGGGLASLVEKESPVPQPGPRKVLIHMRDNSLNAREFSVLNGTYPLPVKPDAGAEEPRTRLVKQPHFAS